MAGRWLLISHSALIVGEARKWLGTPYRHQASCLGAGADCLGLLRGVWRGVLGPEPTSLPRYTADWGEVARQEPLLEGIAAHFIVSDDALSIGQVLVFRMRARSIAKHVGIVACRADGAWSLIHSYSGRGVIEAPLNAGWQNRIAGRFEFPKRRP